MRPRCLKYFSDHNVQHTKFDQFFKGCSKLGGMVEVMVKLVKRLIYGSVKTNVLKLREFEFLVEQIIHIANRRPVAFKETLRDSDIDVPDPISPEKLIHGFDLISVNVIPQLQPVPVDLDFSNDPVANVRDSYDGIRRVRERLIKIYNDEFISGLVSQAVDRKSRYKPVNSECASVGDVVLIKEEYCKLQNYPMGIITKAYENSEGEVTHAEVRKGKTGDICRRHITSLIPLLRRRDDETCVERIEPAVDDSNVSRPRRKAALESRAKTKAILSE